eukprot:Skav221304  [mRNA]  locus=scaffold1920:554220:556157:- [translate_table: standard]
MVAQGQPSGRWVKVLKHPEVPDVEQSLATRAPTPSTPGQLDRTNEFQGAARRPCPDRIPPCLHGAITADDAGKVGMMVIQ